MEKYIYKLFKYYFCVYVELLMSLFNLISMSYLIKFKENAA